MRVLTHVFPRCFPSPAARTSTTLLMLVAMSAYGEALATTVPIGPPTGLSEPLPAPLRIRWVDRCGRGTAGVCGSVACSDTGTCTNQNAPCCTLHYAAGSL